MDIESIELTELEYDHALAKVRWNSFYLKPGGGETQIDFNVYYLLNNRRPG